MRKKIKLLLAFILLITNHLLAQSIERSWTAGFSTFVELLRPYNSDHWLIGARGWPEPGAYFRDTLFVAVVGFDGEVHLRKNLSMPSEEVHYFHDLLALPDGGILVSFESTLCDVSGYLLSVQRLDNQGGLLWDKTQPFVFGQSRPPEKWFVAPDGNLLGASYNQIWKVNSLNGTVLWKADLQGVAGGDTSVFEMALIPGTEHFYALGNPDFQYWKQTGNANAPLYQLEKSAEQPGYHRWLTLSPNGGFYCLQYFPDGQIEYIDAGLAAQALPIQVQAPFVTGIAVGDDGLLLVESNLGENNRFRKFDFQGLNPVELPAPSHWFYPTCLAAHNQWIALAGQNISGPNPPSADHARGSAAWLRSMPDSTDNSTGQNPDASVIDVAQLQPLDTVQSPGFPPYPVLYGFSGGGFQVKVANTGDMPIHQVCVNAVFDFNQYYFCPYTPAKQKVYNGLNLSPGESVWLDFGDIAASGQADAPADICFWTSSPNEQPDDGPDDDRFCAIASYVVGLDNPGNVPLSFYPNPADAYVMATISKSEQNGSWQLYDARGRVVRAGLTHGQQVLLLDTSMLPNGFYLLQIGQRMAKCIVQH